MRVEHVILSAFIFATAAFSLTTLYDGMNNAFSPNTTADFDINYSTVYSETSDVMDEAEEGFGSSVTNILSRAAQFPETVFSGLGIIANVITILFSTVDIGTQLLTVTLAAIPGLPQFVIDNITAAFTTVILFALIAAILKRKM